MIDEQFNDSREIKGDLRPASLSGAILALEAIVSYVPRVSDLIHVRLIFAGNSAAGYLQLADANY